MKSLEELISCLPKHIRDDNDEIYDLTIQPSAFRDYRGEFVSGWHIGYVLINDFINWKSDCNGRTLREAAMNLGVKLLNEIWWDKKAMSYRFKDMKQ